MLPPSGAGAPAPRNSPSFPAVSVFRREVWEGRAGKAAALSCAQLDVRRLGSGAQPAGDPPGAGGAGRRALGAGRSPFASSFPPPCFRLGSSLRAYCARAASSLAHRGRSGAPPGRLGSWAPSAFPRDAAPGQTWLCTCKLCFRNRPWGASLVGGRVFPSSARPQPSVTCRRLCPAVAGARALWLSCTAVSIYRCHCHPAVGRVSVTAMRSEDRRTAHARRLGGSSASETRKEKALGWSLQASLPRRSSRPEETCTFK